ncbi:MAG: serine hydrolase domain-containing protein [Gemmataceae bacterium]|nr:beta-lactamase family protein [Gemmata sp.]MDW8197155.1 serine hydrolase domain-containing protein [Gemmataceae bacterium]
MLRWVGLLTLWAFAFLAFVSPAAAAPWDAAQLAAIDKATTGAIDRGECPGAVIVVLHDDQVVYRKAFGHRTLQPHKTTMTTDTIFDLASLTKPIATGTAIMLLIQQGKIRLDDRVSDYWPQFAAHDKDRVTIAQLLLHTSGLIPDNALTDYADGRAKALERIANLKLQGPPGTQFRYSDVGFIVLGELVERISGQPLDQFAHKHVFEPLKMTDTGFNPPPQRRERLAPTGLRDGKTILGEVHDPRAYRMGGVAGHAGLFSTADDLARYCRMLLRGGELDGVRILEEKTVQLFTKPHPVPIVSKGQESTGLRALGWDVDTSYSGPRGDRFKKGEGYGHTGFTGTSIWIDPGTKTAVIILTHRVHPDDKGNVARLRREVGTIVAQAVGR